MHFPPSTETATVVPTEDDILFGRDAQSLNHEGSKLYRAAVTKYQNAYHSAKARVDKVAIVAKIIGEARQRGARFLKRHTKHVHKWYEVDHKACIEKVSESCMFHS